MYTSVFDGEEMTFVDALYFTIVSCRRGGGICGGGGCGGFHHGGTPVSPLV